MVVSKIDSEATIGEHSRWVDLPLRAFSLSFQRKRAEISRVRKDQRKACLRKMGTQTYKLVFLIGNHVGDNE